MLHGARNTGDGASAVLETAAPANEHRIRYRPADSAAPIHKAYLEVPKTKFTWISVTTSTGSPLSRVGVYFH